MRAAVIFYHKNIQAIYQQRWIDKCVESIANQTMGDFDVIELDYDGTGKRLACIEGREHIPYNINMPNHIHAMNFLLDEAFCNLGYDVVFNTNMDDYYHTTRFEKQAKKIEEGYDLVSSDFCYIQDVGRNDAVTHHMEICKHGSISENLQRDHNVIAHPCVAYSKTFWDGNLRYEDLLGYEDLELWKRADRAGKRLHIIDEELLFYRIHQKQVTKSYGGPA